MWYTRTYVLFFLDFSKENFTTRPNEDNKNREKNQWMKNARKWCARARVRGSVHSVYNCFFFEFELNFCDFTQKWKIRVERFFRRIMFHRNRILFEKVPKMSSKEKKWLFWHVIITRGLFMIKSIVSFKLLRFRGAYMHKSCRV